MLAFIRSVYVFVFETYVVMIHRWDRGTHSYHRQWLYNHKSRYSGDRGQCCKCNGPTFESLRGSTMIQFFLPEILPTSGLSSGSLLTNPPALISLPYTYSSEIMKLYSLTTCTEDKLNIYTVQ